MERVICSSFFFGDSVTHYANMRKKNLESHNEVYIKTVICLFSSARYFSEEVKLIFYVNDIQRLNQIREGYYKNVLKNLQVEVVEVSSHFVDATKRWSGSMFIFDIIKYIVKTDDHIGKKGYYFLDTDVIFLNDFNKVIDIIDKYEWAGYAQFSEFGRFNCWLENFHGINIERDNKVAVPYGGEFLYLNSRTIPAFFETFESLYKDKSTFYFTEEHYYTAILNSEEFLSKKNINVNPFFKRAYRVNRCLDDQFLWGLHFPGEKDYKLKYLFKSLKKKNFVYSPKLAKKILGVSTFFNVYDFISIGKIAKAIYRKIISGWR
ncbi:hypothetical protein ACPOM7_02295 [Peribacillus castrilensis]|uniref:hypothetical protein n=1 Tax=Peribacillus TaxID=2675229 RepID=UPI0030F8BA25